MKILKLSHSAEKCERRTVWNFLTFILLQIIKKHEGGPFEYIKYFQKKSHSAEKYQKGGDLLV